MEKDHEEQRNRNVLFSPVPVPTRLVRRRVVQTEGFLEVAAAACTNYGEAFGRFDLCRQEYFSSNHIGNSPG